MKLHKKCYLSSPPPPKKKKKLHAKTQNKHIYQIEEEYLNTRVCVCMYVCVCVCVTFLFQAKSPKAEVPRL